jgi:diguanylate cyclase (GGDEF)-like protein
LALSMPVAADAAPPAPQQQRSGGFEAAIAASKAAMMSKPDVALREARTAAAAAEQLTGTNQTEALATAHWLEGEALTRLNRPDQAKPIIDRALAAAVKASPNSKLHADLLKSRASLHVLGGDVGMAMATLHQAHGIYVKLQDPRSQAIILQNIGSIYGDAKDYRQALRYYELAREAYSDDPKLVLAANNNRGNAHKELGEFRRAEEAYQQALAAAKASGSPLLEARILTNIASAQLLQGNMAEADRTAKRALALAKGPAAEWKPFVWGVMAQIASVQGDKAAAAKLIEQTFAGIDPQKSTMLFRDFHATAHSIFASQGRYAEALTHLRALKRLDDEASKVAASANTALMNARFDTAHQELRVLKSRQQLQTVTELAAAGGAAAAIVIAAIFFALMATRRSRRRINEANATLTYAARHDALTGLVNRAYSRELLRLALERAQQTGDHCGLLLIDLDRFKQVNDTLGHAGGDELLKIVARHLTEIAGQDCHPVRVGGDEFAIVVSEAATPEHLARLAEEVVAKLSEPQAIHGATVLIGASVGIALGPDEGDTVDKLVRNADLALYQAKGGGRGRAMRFESHMLEAADEQNLLEIELREALARDQLSLVFQPIVDAATGAVVAREALIRWQHPQRGWVDPAKFVAIAESTGLINRIGAWVLQRACREAVSWPASEKLAVNLSVAQVENESLASTVLNALAWSGLEPGRLELEISEGVFLGRGINTEATLGQLREIGVALVLDDFGTGYSSLSYLQRDAFSKVKIDRSFVRPAAEGDTGSLAIVQAIIAMATSFGMGTTAEGIETEAQKATMCALGCTELQGYLFGKPESSSLGSNSDADRPTGACKANAA